MTAAGWKYKNAFAMNERKSQLMSALFFKGIFFFHFGKMHFYQTLYIGNQVYIIVFFFVNFVVAVI